MKEKEAGFKVTILEANDDIFSTLYSKQPHYPLSLLAAIYY